MTYLLDTTAVSELTQPRPNPGYAAWSAARGKTETFIGAPTLAELVQGVYAVPPSVNRSALEAWLRGIEEQFGSSVLPFDADAARVLGVAAGAARRRGRTLPTIDSQLAAIAIVNKLTLVTRNIRDFEVPGFEGLKVISPWT